MINIPIFEPLDMPPDIIYQKNDLEDFYIFTKKISSDNSLKFIITINVENQKLECYEYLNNTISTNRIFNYIEYDRNNINDLLWKISDYNYSFRYMRLEIIERLRKINEENSYKDIIDFLKNFNKDYISDSDNDA